MTSRLSLIGNSFLSAENKPVTDLSLCKEIFVRKLYLPLPQDQLLPASMDEFVSYKVHPMLYVMSNDEAGDLLRVALDTKEAVQIQSLLLSLGRRDVLDSAELTLEQEQALCDFLNQSVSKTWRPTALSRLLKVHSQHFGPGSQIQDDLLAVSDRLVCCHADRLELKHRVKHVMPASCGVMILKEQITAKGDVFLFCVALADPTVPETSKSLVRVR